MTNEILHLDIKVTEDFITGKASSKRQIGVRSSL